MKQKNLAIELLRKILNDEIRVRLKYNITQGKGLWRCSRPPSRSTRTTS
jgi:hypothetical protein